jgi:hypothetical protein
MSALQWQASGVSYSCPTYTDLVARGLLDAQVSHVGGSDVRIACLASDVTVVWAGHDRLFGTVDDETVPDPLGDEPPLVIAKLGWMSAAAIIVTLLLTVFAILATVRGWSNTPSLARAASSTGLFMIVAGVTAGFLDMTVTHIAATRPDLSRGDAERCRGRGNRSFVWESALGLFVGTPGIVIRPSRRRRRRNSS